MAAQTITFTTKDDDNATSVNTKFVASDANQIKDAVNDHAAKIDELESAPVGASEWGDITGDPTDNADLVSFVTASQSVDQIIIDEYNANTNTPTLSTIPAFTEGYYYQVTVAGTNSFVTGTSKAFSIGDKIISNGAKWVVVPAVSINEQGVRDTPLTGFDDTYVHNPATPVTVTDTIIEAFTKIWAFLNYLLIQIGYTPKVFNVRFYGANPLSGKFILRKAVTTSGSATLTAAGAGFTSGDVGKIIMIVSQTFVQKTTISAVTNSTTITLANVATGTTTTADLYYGTDQTTYIQAAMNAANAAMGGEAYAPKGLYLINGPLVTSDNNGFNPNGQLFFPSNPKPFGYDGDNTAKFITLKLRGELPASSYESGFVDSGAEITLQGTVFVSTLLYSEISGGYPGVISVMGAPNAYGPFSYNEHEIENIHIRVPADPTRGTFMSGFMMRMAGELMMENNRADNYYNIDRSFAPTIEAYGFFPVFTNGGTKSQMRGNIAVGFKYNFAICEHTFADDNNSFGGEYAMRFFRAGHGSYIGRMLCQWNKYNIGTSPDGGFDEHFTVISALTIERVNITGKWYNFVADINDSGNILKGQAFFTSRTSGASSPDLTPIKIGGSKFSMRHMSMSTVNPMYGGDNDSAIGDMGAGFDPSYPRVVISAGRAAAGFEDAFPMFATAADNSYNNGVVAVIRHVNKAYSGSVKSSKFEIIENDGNLSNSKTTTYVVVGGTLTQALQLSKKGVYLGIPIYAGENNAASSGGLGLKDVYATVDGRLRIGVQGSDLLPEYANDVAASIGTPAIRVGEWYWSPTMGTTQRRS